MSKTTADYNDLEIRQKKRWLKSYIAHGAITDVAKCKKASDFYWRSWRNGWVKHSDNWRYAFINASILASGIDLFHGGFFIHKYGDPVSKDSIKRRSISARYTEVEGKMTQFPGPEAVKTYRRNIIKNKDGLVRFGGIDYYKEHLKGIAYAARIFGIKFS